jgi:hypothetical protein
LSYYPAISNIPVTVIASTKRYEAPKFTITTVNESFTTAEDIYDQIEPRATYFLSVKGWAFYDTKRKIIDVY